MSSDPTLQWRALLDTARADAPGAMDQLVPLIYDELRALAHRQLARERRDLTPRNRPPIRA